MTLRTIPGKLYSLFRAMPLIGCRHRPAKQRTP